MKKIIYFTFILLFMSCKNDNSKLSKAVLSKTFYDFDKVEFYNLNITNNDVDKLSSLLMEGDLLSKKDSINESIYMFATNISPKILNEKEINLVLNSTKSQKETIDLKYFKTLKSKIFIEKKCNFNEHMIPSIMPLYSDIFIFWKENKIIGLAKLNSNGPFMHIFKGTDKNTNCFGQNGEIKYLKEIIKTKLSTKC